MMTNVLTGDYDSTKDSTKYVVELTQTQDGWQNEENETGLTKAGINASTTTSGESTTKSTPVKNGKATLTYTASTSGGDGTVTVTYASK